MPKRLFTLYQRKRWININVNAIAAGVVSTVLVMGLVWVIRHPGGVDLGPMGFTIFALLADIVLDVACFLALHWAANHWRPVSGRTEKEQRELQADRPDTVRDTARVQGERMALGPIYYLLASGVTFGLQRAGMDPSFAVGLGYLAALVFTRTLHTMWGLRSGSFVDHHKRPGNANPAADGDRDGARTAGPSDNSPTDDGPSSDHPADAA